MPDKTTVIIIAASAFALMGAAGLFLPRAALGQFGIVDPSRDARNEARAVYGGFGVAAAAVLAWSAHAPDMRAGVCLTLGALLAGMAAGRLVSAAIDRGAGRAPALYFCIEAAGAALLGHAAVG
jgi:hypothetical protein